jgi:ribonucleoside-diphosphate reductase alpha chain
MGVLEINMSLPTDYQSFIHASRYARYLDDKQRRETWEETVDRYISFFTNHLKENFDFSFDAKTLNKIRTSIINLDVMPSMRAMMTAGPALERCNVAGYNCSYLPIDDQRAFDELLYILMCGTGVGFSVERQFVNELPVISDQFDESSTTIVVEDSKEGWAKAFRELVSMLYGGRIPKWDVSKVRPAGARLKTFGGRASGPEPLVDLFKFAVRLFQNAKGRKLTSIECHDLACKVAEVVVVGGVRRSALISLSNLSDDRMRQAKSGAWWETEPQRALANNSVCYTERPDTGSFMQEWLALYQSKSGERGIFNRVASEKQAVKNGRREGGHEWGTNPCSEIILRPYQFCNLTELVCRAGDDHNDMMRKVEVAAILGTIQSTMTDFRYLRRIWKKNTEEERLLGVSLTGILDSKFVYDAPAEHLEAWRDHAVFVNKKLSEKLGINQSTAVTCVKPSGTVSQLVDSASGIHARHSPYYIRRVRGDKKDPITTFMSLANIPVEDDVMKPEATAVFSFPIKAPEGSITRNDLSAIEQLELWLKIQRHWCEHKPSITVTVKEHEWVEVGAWVWKHFDEVSGISFLPHSDHSYRQAPYEECDKETYEKLLSSMPTAIDWRELGKFEQGDRTTGSQDLACSAGVCEVVDLT